MRHAMIMAGGSGTRLWPMSRAARPKQLVPLVDGKSLLAIAFDRLHGVVPDANRLVCTNRAHGQAVLEAVPDMTSAQMLGEPCPRDTVNAIALTAAALHATDPDAVFAVLTADHLITPVDTFAACLDAGFALVEADPSRMVTFGITPTHAATGYGYVELGEPIDDTASCVQRFVEKPDATTAQGYVDAGNYKWNSGMFVFSAAGFLAALDRFLPEAAAGARAIGAAWTGEDRTAVLDATYPDLPKISVDYAVMEPASTADDIEVCCVPMDIQWLDVGSWEAAAETLQADDHGNRASGEVAQVNCTSTVVFNDNPNHLIATVGCDDIIVVHAGTATLVCPLSAVQDVKTLVEQLPEQWR
ncbi:MAG: mannose-1-phosphate guanylyltransferase [Phycisphaerales bacterium]|nr:mannose-1-phosphate guanylyltransferase [Phycisphaerales bacterium]